MARQKQKRDEVERAGMKAGQGRGKDGRARNWKKLSKKGKNNEGTLSE